MNQSIDVPKRRLGRNGPLVSAMGFGAMGMSAFYHSNPSDEAEYLKVLNHAIDIGCTFWDTAELYGPFKNEELLAKVLHHRRSEIFICTKFGVLITEKGLNLDSSPAKVKASCDGSLKRLGIDCIDLYYQHRPDPNTPIEDTVRAMAELVKEGKVKYLGLSECTAEEIRRAHKVHPITAYQVEYSPWFMNIENDGRLDTCRELGIAIIAYSPLGRGFLTGAIKTIDDLSADDWRRTNPKFKAGAFEKNLALVEEIKKLSSQKGCTPAQLCLAWVMAQGPDFIPIPGTKRLQYLDENWAALKVGLSPFEVEQMRLLFSKIPIEGSQY